ncbi:OmpL47-type beta-barrel domain-containing protein [Kitasatospora sp. NPDC057015]|uniref:OmpL47-type beta-barrel domain-containing protein n=1 Tax=Kitasatospora sp. NPDC057015 TaxID=3346001 RepID=UPI0036377DD2
MRPGDGMGPRRPRTGTALAVLAVLLLWIGMASPAVALKDFRTTSVVLANNSDLPLILTDHYLDHGCWETEPPERIEPGRTVLWKSVSCGIGTGVEGSAFYRVEHDAGPNLRVHWDNSATGSQSYEESLPNGYVISRSGGDGDHATVSYTFDCNSRMCDGIPDDWKLHGVTVDPGDGSGPQFVDLPAMGADVDRPDIFVQLDWMVNSAHSHKLDPEAIKKVVDAFANAPFQRRGAARPGIDLHIDQGPDSILDFATGRTWGALSRARAVTEYTHLGNCNGDGSCNPDHDSGYDFGEFDDIKKRPGGVVGSGRFPVFHYALSAHQIADSGVLGITSHGSSDFILSLGGLYQQVGLPDDQATVFMHELGHNLGLDHGGFERHPDHKPQYFSVMNVAYSKDGIPYGTSRYADYSRVATTLDENHLDESAVPPTGSSLRYDVTRYCGRSYVTAVHVGLDNYVDWNCNGTQDSGTVSADIDGDGSLTIIVGYDDWAHLKLTGGSVGGLSMPGTPEPQELEEFNEDPAKQVEPLDTTDPVTTAVADPPSNDSGWHATAVTVTLGATDDLSGVARTEYDVDGAGWTAYSGPIRLDSPGSHTLSYRSVDRAQNTEPTGTLPVRIDREPPVTTAVLNPQPNPAGWINANGTVTLTATDDLSGAASITYRTTNAQSTPSTTVAGDTAELTISQEGETVITFHATDRAGNVEADRTLTVRLDKAPPGSKITTSSGTIFVARPPGGPLDDQYVTGTASDPGSGVDHVDVTFTSKVPGPTIVERATPSCADPTLHSCTWRVRPPSDIGIYRVTSAATDVAGNVETPGPGIDLVVVRNEP